MVARSFGAAERRSSATHPNIATDKYPTPLQMFSRGRKKTTTFHFPKIDIAQRRRTFASPDPNQLPNTYSGTSNDVRLVEPGRYAVEARTSSRSAVDGRLQMGGNVKIIGAQQRWHADKHDGRVVCPDLNTRYNVHIVRDRHVKFDVGAIYFFVGVEFGGNIHQISEGTVPINKTRVVGQIRIKFHQPPPPDANQLRHDGVIQTNRY